MGRCRRCRSRSVRSRRPTRPSTTCGPARCAGVRCCKPTARERRARYLRPRRKSMSHRRARQAAQPSANRGAACTPVGPVLLRSRMATRTPPRKKAAGSDAAEPAARVLRRFRLVFNTVKGHFRAVERKAGISGAQLWALSVVHANPGIGVSELARAMDVHQSTASNLLRALVDKELVVA